MLTDDRRTELLALLSDQQRLRAEYPNVADYLEMAPMLSGTGNEQADAEFGLRFAHFLTGGSSSTGNPYWEVVEPFVSQRERRRVVDGGNVSGSARLAFAQTILQRHYAYAIPSPETVEWCLRFSDGSGVVEIGAGRGYWAAQLAKAGIEVRAYDSEPPGQTNNASFPRVPGQPDTWYEVGDLAEPVSAVRGEDVLLLCWPPGWGDRMASDSLAAFERSGGNRLIFIGEPKGGKTGDDAFFERLTEAWVMESRDESYVSWWNLADVAQGWRRR